MLSLRHVINHLTPWLNLLQDSALCFIFISSSSQSPHVLERLTERLTKRKLFLRSYFSQLKNWFFGESYFSAKLAEDNKIIQVAIRPMNIALESAKRKMDSQAQQTEVSRGLKWERKRFVVDTFKNNYVRLEVFSWNEKSVVVATPGFFEHDQLRAENS
jgi:hypothetical protein